MMNIAHTNQNISHSEQGEWDLIKDGKKLISFQSFLSYSEEMNAKSVQQAIEENGFTTVNKVKSPSTYQVSLALQGHEFELKNLLTILDNELHATSLLQVVTPYGITPKSTLITKKISRKSVDGLSLIIVDLVLCEVEVITTSFTQSSKITAENAFRISDISPIDFGKKTLSIFEKSFASFL